MIKTATMEAFTNFDAANQREGSVLDNRKIIFPSIQIIVATSAANIDMSSNHLMFAKHKQLPSLHYNIV